MLEWKEFLPSVSQWLRFTLKHIARCRREPEPSVLGYSGHQNLFTEGPQDAAPCTATSQLGCRGRCFPVREAGRPSVSDISTTRDGSTLERSEGWRRENCIGGSRLGSDGSAGGEDLGLAGLRTPGSSCAG